MATPGAGDNTDAGCALPCLLEDLWTFQLPRDSGAITSACIVAASSVIPTSLAAANQAAATGGVTLTPVLCVGTSTGGICCFDAANGWPRGTLLAANAVAPLSSILPTPTVASFSVGGGRLSVGAAEDSSSLLAPNAGGIRALCAVDVPFASPAAAFNAEMAKQVILPEDPTQGSSRKGQSSLKGVKAEAHTARVSPPNSARRHLGLSATLAPSATGSNASVVTEAAYFSLLFATYENGQVALWPTGGIASGAAPIAKPSAIFTPPKTASVGGTGASGRESRTQDALPMAFRPPLLVAKPGIVPSSSTSSRRPESDISHRPSAVAAILMPASTAGNVTNSVASPADLQTSAASHILETAMLFPGGALCVMCGFMEQAVRLREREAAAALTAVEKLKIKREHDLAAKRRGGLGR
jgi:hypothetical protein